MTSPDETLRSGLLTDAELTGIEVHCLSLGQSTLVEAAHRECDLVVLDDRVTDTSVHRLVQELHRQQRGVVVVASDTSELNVVLLLELGADDVLRRPYSTPELRARVHALLRRRTAGTRSRREPPHAQFCLNGANRSITLRGRQLHVPRLEFAVLRALNERDGAPVQRGALLDECWPSESVRRPEYVDAVIRRLRVRLEVQPARPEHIITVRSKGYALRP